MIDRKAFRSLSSGLYLITAKAGDARCGCVVNTLVQVASEPATLSVSLNKENATTAAILESGRFAATVLAEDTPMELIGTFGFHTSADTDKFAACASALDGAEVPYVTEHGLALHHLRLHRGRLPGRPARGLHVPHLRRPPRDVRARGTVEGAAHLPCVDLQRACKPIVGADLGRPSRAGSLACGEGRPRSPPTEVSGAR